MFEQIKEWWDNISEREQQLTFISLVVVFIAVIYFLIWQPIATNLAASQQKLQSSEQTLQWVESNANKLVVAGVGNKKTTARKQNLSQLISNTAKRNKIVISRIQNRNGSVDIWINQVEFNQFLKWITALQNQYQIQVNSADLNQDKTQGMVKVNRLSLSY
ncbi:type II secretion system protein M [uncultured Psychromonas sp.]|uniref:type II secretion system protein M n=1 Tax=uncultured Psychromonas sp. TaxID=173974 RepID=UPI00261A6E48|nr:type II secretion system protein M [uncultured Psychromonas sp.]